MLAEHTAQVDAEEDSSGQPSVWRYVYKLMRCGGPPCHLGPHCWVDPDGRKHYKLKTHHMKALIRHVESGGILESHDDVPQSFREQVYAEEQQYAERQAKKGRVSNMPADGYPPINIQLLQSEQPNRSRVSSASTTAPVPTLSASMSTFPGS